MANISKINVGSRVRVVNDTVSHNYEIGKTLTVKSRSSSNIYVKEGPTYLPVRDVILVPETLKELESRLKDIEKNIESLNEEANGIEDVISFMKDRNIDEYSEEEYRVYKLVSKLKKVGTCNEKELVELSKEIYSLVR